MAGISAENKPKQKGDHNEDNPVPIKAFEDHEIVTAFGPQHTPNETQMHQLDDASRIKLRAAILVPIQPSDEKTIPKPKYFWQCPFFWPPDSLPDSLYSQVVSLRWKSQILYHFTSTLYSFCLVLQLVLGASLTGLASKKDDHDTAVTIIAAINTVNAGIVALLHNSGLPTRIRNDWNEYLKVEIEVKSLLDSGIVEAGVSWEDAAAHCRAALQEAMDTVESNKPSAYAKAATTSLVHPGWKLERSSRASEKRQ